MAIVLVSIGNLICLVCVGEIGLIWASIGEQPSTEANTCCYVQCTFFSVAIQQWSQCFIYFVAGDFFVLFISFYKLGDLVGFANLLKVEILLLHDRLFVCFK